MYEPIKKEIYERPKKMAQKPNPFAAKAEEKQQGPKFRDGSDFKKGAIQRRLAKMNSKSKTVEAKDAK